MFIFFFYCSFGLHYKGRTNQRIDGWSQQNVLTKIRNFIYFSMDVLKDTYGSFITDNQINNFKCTNNFNVDLYSIENNAHSSFHLKKSKTYITSKQQSFRKQRKMMFHWYCSPRRIVSFFNPINTSVIVLTNGVS